MAQVYFELVLSKNDMELDSNLRTAAFLPAPPTLQVGVQLSQFGIAARNWRTRVNGCNTDQKDAVGDIERSGIHVDGCPSNFERRQIVTDNPKAVAYPCF